MTPEHSAILTRLNAQPCRRPNTWLARCPAHNDRHPSLWLWIGKRGELVAKCFANRGCRWDDIVRASGTDPRDWYPPQLPRGSWSRRRRNVKIVASYDYQDAEGSLLYQVLRLEPKDFRVRQPDKSRLAEWVWTLEGVERVPYRLPDLLARPEWPVVVVEGEKDVESLHRLGLVATCNAGGAGKWTPELSRWLKGRRVAILPDNDPPGHVHATQVAGSLMDAGAASISMVYLPQLPDGGDVSDWLADSLPTVTDAMKRKSLIELIRKAPVWSVTNAAA